MNRVLLVGLIFLGILFVPSVARNLIERLPFVEVVNPSELLTPMQEKQLEIRLESISLLITLATLVFGGVALLIGTSNKDSGSSFLKEPFLMYGSMILAGLSIVFGYLSYEMLVWMLSTKIFNLDTPVFLWSRTLQYWSFMLSVACFGVLAVVTLRPERVG